MEQSLQTVNHQANDVVEVSLRELQQGLRDKSLIVVDVLPSEAYASGHIPGAISLPLAEVSSRAHELLPDRNAAIAVYCASAT
jgi:rhodanese-related sulfurtransferase